MTASFAFLQQSRTRQLLCVKSLNWHCNIMPCSLNREFIFKCSANTTCENIMLVVMLKLPNSDVTPGCRFSGIRPSAGIENSESNQGSPDLRSWKVDGGLGHQKHPLEGGQHLLEVSSQGITLLYVGDYIFKKSSQGNEKADNCWDSGGSFSLSLSGARAGINCWLGLKIILQILACKMLP